MLPTALNCLFHKMLRHVANRSKLFVSHNTPGQRSKLFVSHDARGQLLQHEQFATAPTWTICHCSNMNNLPLVKQTIWTACETDHQGGCYGQQLQIVAVVMDRCYGPLLQIVAVVMGRCPWLLLFHITIHFSTAMKNLINTYIAKLAFKILSFYEMLIKGICILIYKR
jgi:hypothetical protein